jgi:hypothetical protein
MRQRTKNHRNQGSIEKKIRFFSKFLRHISRWVRFVQKTRSKNSHAWAPLKILTNEKRGRLKVISTDRSRREFHQNLFRPHPVRGLKLLSDPCFYYLNTIIVSKHSINLELRHSSHIIHLTETTELYVYPRGHGAFSQTKKKFVQLNFLLHN